MSEDGFLYLNKRTRSHILKASCIDYEEVANLGFDQKTAFNARDGGRDFTGIGSCLLNFDGRLLWGSTQLQERRRSRDPS